MMSKLGWDVDDPRFMGLSNVQWSWIGSMIAKEEQKEYDMYLQFVEYAASFWNYEAVNKIRENREKRNRHSFLSDKEFEESVKKQDFKLNPWVERIIKMRKNNANFNEYSDLNKQQQMAKSPTDLSYLASLTEED